MQLLEKLNRALDRKYIPEAEGDLESQLQAALGGDQPQAQTTDTTTTTSTDAKGNTSTSTDSTTTDSTDPNSDPQCG
jgi:hypothetical protein